MVRKNISFIGLGKMGQNMVENLLSKNYKVIVYNRSVGPVKKMVKKGAIGAYSIEELFYKNVGINLIIMMVPAGKAVDSVILKIKKFLKKGDILIDGGNSHYKDSIRRYKNLKKEGINYLDMGTSGGLIGARNGASLMIGGDKDIFKKIEFVFRDLSVKMGYGYMGKSGSGHFVKMIHNGIEYGILEAYGEGFEVLEKSKFNFDYELISRVWNNGSVIRSWITELAEYIFRNNPKLSGVDGVIGGGETGKWNLIESRKLGVESEVLRAALKKRKISKKRQSFSTKFISLIRHEFGGHVIERKKR